MDTFFTYVSYFFYGVVFLLAFYTFYLGLRMIFEVKEITIGKVSSQIIAVIFAAIAFYRIDAIPYLENIIPQITIEEPWVEWVFKILFSGFILYFLFILYGKWREEVDKIKDDTKIIYIMVLFGISSMCFGYIA